ncbi:Nnf1-domain-containing protein [Scheffersomyces xylosifermentans]|uniref:Nnf1-domain-containing protein n=1 Tax=Scheffersomyces xylosifermentans TaxID=1304137 RepID=UPI00315C9E63
MSEEVEKIRYDRLKVVCRRALEQSIRKSLNSDSIKSCYPSIAATEDGSRSLETARSQMTKFWFDSSMKEFELIFKEKNVDTKLNELDEIIQTAQRRKQSHQELPAHIDKLSADELIESTLLQGSDYSLDSLSMIYNQLCLDNTEMFEELQSLSTESESLKTDINAQLALLKKEVEVIDSQSTDFNLEELIVKLTENAD